MKIENQKIPVKTDDAIECLDGYACSDEVIEETKKAVLEFKAKQKERQEK